MKVLNQKTGQETSSRWFAEVELEGGPAPITCRAESEDKAKAAVTKYAKTHYGVAVVWPAKKSAKPVDDATPTEPAPGNDPTPPVAPGEAQTPPADDPAPAAGKKAPKPPKAKASSKPAP